MDDFNKAIRKIHKKHMVKVVFDVFLIITCVIAVCWLVL